MAKLGLDAVLYRGSAGSAGLDWTELCAVRDLTLNMERGTTDISTRCSDMEMAETTLQKIGLEWEMIWDEDDADFAAVLDAYVNNTAIDLKCLSSSDGSGVSAEWKIVKMNRKEALKEAITAEVSAIPTHVTRYPEWIDAT